MKIAKKGYKKWLNIDTENYLIRKKTKTSMEKITTGKLLLLKENKEKLKEYQKEYKLNWYQSMSEEERRKIKEYMKKYMKKYKKS